MNEKTIAAIALSNRDFPSFAAKLQDAVTWIELAAAQGADLAVLPEMLNLYAGDGPGNPNAIPLEEAALDNWQGQTAPLFAVARRCRIAVTIPVLIREGKDLANCFFLVTRDGRVAGEYRKRFPTIGELDAGVRPGTSELIEWEGLKVGGAICFDTNFPEVFEDQARAGAQLFLVPSLWPGGRQLNHFAFWHAAPVVLSYPAWSRIIDLDGIDLVATGFRNETLRFGFGSPIALATLNFDRVQLTGDKAQASMVSIQRFYGKAVRVQFDQQNCLFLLESRATDLTVRQILEKFDLVDRRAFLADSEKRCRQQRGIPGS